MTFFELAAKISDVSRSRVAYVSCSLGKIFSQMSGPLLITRHGMSGQKEGVREPGVRGNAHRMLKYTMKGEEKNTWP